MRLFLIQSINKLNFFSLIELISLINRNLIDDWWLISSRSNVSMPEWFNCIQSCISWLLIASLRQNIRKQQINQDWIAMNPAWNYYALVACILIHYQSNFWIILTMNVVCNLTVIIFMRLQLISALINEFHSNSWIH